MSGIFTIILGLIIGLSPDTLWNNVKNRLLSIQSYTCELESYEKLGSKESHRWFDFRYKSPGWIYMKIVKGNDKGATIVYNPEKDRVKAAKGGILSIIKINAKPENKRVKSLRGYKITDSPFPAVVRRLDRYFKNAREVKLDTLHGLFIVMQGVKNPEEPDIAKVVIEIDPGTMLLKGYTEYSRENRVLHRVVYRKLNLNPELSNKDFEF